MSSFVPAAAAAAAAYWAPSLLSPILGYISFLFAALALVFATSRERAAATAAIGIAVGLFIGVTGITTARKVEHPHLPLPVEAITYLEGTVQDSRSGSGSDAIPFEVALQRAGSAVVQAEASGMITVRATLERDLAAGTVVRVTPAGVWVSPEGRVVVDALELAELGDRKAGDPGNEASDAHGLDGLRERILSQIAGAIASMPPEVQGLTRALILGEPDALDSRTVSLFRRAGASHVLALSGMHLGVIALIGVFVARPLVGRRWAARLAIAAALVYVWIIGPRPSLVRAALMGTIALACSEWDRPVSLVELLAATFVIHVLLQPAAPGSLGFQLSYLSLLAIGVVGTAVVRAGEGRVPTIVLAPVSAGLAAQAGTAPLVLSAFGVLYPAGIVSNVVLAPLVTAFMVSGFGSLAGALVQRLTGLAVVSRVVGAVLVVVGRGIERVVWRFASGPVIYGDSIAAIPAATALAVALLVAGLYSARRQIVWTGQE